MENPELVATGIVFPEGLAWFDGKLACTRVQEGVLYAVAPGDGHVEVIAAVGGGLNGVVAATTGFVVTQNGGIDASAPSKSIRVASLEA